LCQAITKQRRLARQSIESSCAMTGKRHLLESLKPTKVKNIMV